MSVDARQRALLGATLDPEVVRRLAQPIRVSVAGGDPPWRHQIAAIALVDILGRLHTHIQICVEPKARADSLLPPGPDLLGDRLREAAHHGGLEISFDEIEEPDVHIAVGPVQGADLYVDGSGWLSYVGTSVSTALADDATNPVGPLAAACRGAAQVFQTTLSDLLSVTTSVDGSYWSALKYTSVSSNDIGPPLSGPNVDALLMGAGSIGGAVAYTLARVPRLGGALTVCDPQQLELRNARKALLAREADLEPAREKALVAADEFAHTAVEVTSHVGTLSEWVAARPACDPLPLVLCAVDSIPARRELQDHMPLEVVNAACGDLDITVSGHVTDDGPCVYCLHIERVLDSAASRKAILARETGMPERTVSEHLTKGTPLNEPMLRAIAQHRHEPIEKLLPWVGHKLDELYREYILYGEARLQTDQGDAAIVAPFVTALAGILMAGEALKLRSGPDVSGYRLGSAGRLPVKYEESLVHAPVGMLSNVPRWEGDECLCRSTRRLGLFRPRYGLDTT
jgi:molybdopterin/thiamine biosynthesis adenylyltransferase